MERLEITSLKTNSENIDVQEVQYRTDGKTARGLDITLKPGHPLGRLDGEVKITTNLESRPEYTLPVRGSIISNIVVEPRVIVYHIYPDRQDSTQKITISRPGVPGFRVSEISAENNIVRWNLSQGEKETYTLTVFLNRNEIMHNPERGTVYVHTNDPDEPKYKIPVNVYLHSKERRSEPVQVDRSKLKKVR
jgi:hypothetical protein